VKHSDQRISEEESGQEQAAGKKRGQTARRSRLRRSATREATRDPGLSDAEKTPGSGMTSDGDESEAPSG